MDASFDVLVLGESGPAVVSRTLGLPAYDFDLRRMLAARSQRYDEPIVDAVLRVGPIADYAALVDQLATRDVHLANDVEAHRRASQLSCWYERLEGITPRSEVYSTVPDAAEVERAFGWPVFVKGDRQTNRHDASLAIARDPAAFDALIERYANDPVLHWQELVVREHLALRVVEARAPGGLPAAFEFRTFWWRSQLLEAGPYWSSGSAFRWNDEERRAGLKVAQQAADAVDVPFLVVDLAQAADGRWWVIECNDAQESSYAGCSPVALWQRMVALRA